MGLTSALHLGASGLIAQQTAIETTGNNLANMSTDGYKRQRVELSSLGDREVQNNQYVGQGVQIQSITRQVSEAIEGRLRNSISDEAAAAVTEDQLARIEAVQNELTGRDLSTQLTEYFDAWSQLTTNPQDTSLRTLVTSQGAALSSFINDQRLGYSDIRTETTAGLGEAIDAADSLLSRIEALNDTIAQTEGSGGSASSLRDQRDQLLAELSQYLEISTVEQNNGAIDVFVGSLPVILNGESRGVELRSRTVDGEQISEVVISDDGAILNIDSGELGARIQFINGSLQNSIDNLDTLAAQLIYQTNLIHSQGQGTAFLDEVTGTYEVTDPTAALNDSTLTELPFSPKNGSFEISVVNKTTGQATTTTIEVDLDGVNPATDTTLNDLAAAIDAVTGVSAQVNGAGQLEVLSDSANSGFAFSNDTSGVLASLGINTFFTGKNAYDMAVNTDLVGDPAFVAAAQERLTGDNRNALAQSDLRDAALTEIGGFSLTQFWSNEVEELGISLARASDEREAFSVVRENLESSQAAVSGVNADEETINLLAFQRAYQASARFITVVDELTQTLLALV